MQPPYRAAPPRHSYDDLVEWLEARRATERLGAAMQAGDELARQRWAECGGLELTGEPDHGPDDGPARVALAFDHWAGRATHSARRLGAELRLDGARLLGERIATHEVRRRGRVSAGGACRLLRSADDWVALSLVRPDDLAALDALFERALGLASEPRATGEQTWQVPEHAWQVVGAAVARCPAAMLVERAGLLGLACSRLGERAPDAQLFTASHVEPAAGRADATQLFTVVDLSSLWAGPLCSRILRSAGARVHKVESNRRPDGARHGPPAFFDVMNAGKDGHTVDLGSREGRSAARDLLAASDVVIEGSRPRALQQMGLAFDDLYRDGWRGVWLSITAHGAVPQYAARVGYGDDAAVAGGLVGRGPTFCADAIADPATGLLGAAVVLAALADGVTAHLQVSLANTAAHLARHALVRR